MMNHYAKGFDTEPEEKSVSKLGLFFGAFLITSIMVLFGMWISS